MRCNHNQSCMFLQYYASYLALCFLISWLADIMKNSLNLCFGIESLFFCDAYSIFEVYSSTKLTFWLICGRQFMTKTLPFSSKIYLKMFLTRLSCCLTTSFVLLNLITFLNLIRVYSLCYVFSYDYKNSST